MVWCMDLFVCVCVCHPHFVNHHTTCFLFFVHMLSVLCIHMDHTISPSLSYHSPSPLLSLHPQQVPVPDKHPTELIKGPNLLSMAAGDFVECYADPQCHASFDAVATCFFIDTAHNIVTYMQVILDVLKVGGRGVCVWGGGWQLLFEVRMQVWFIGHGVVIMVLSSWSCSVHPLPFHFHPTGRGLLGQHGPPALPLGRQSCICRGG